MPDDVNTTQPDGAGQQPALRTFTQEEVNAIAADARRQARDAAQRDLLNRYGDPDALLKAKTRLDELEAAQLSEADKLRKQIDDLTQAQETAAQQLRAEKLNTLRLKVGQELGLPPVLAERLTGEDEEALKVDAQKVLAGIKESGRTVLPNVNATEGALTSKPSGTVKLTPGQQAAAKASGMTHEAYIEALQKMEQGAKQAVNVSFKEKPKE